MKRLFLGTLIVLLLGIFANKQEANAYDYCKLLCEEIDWTFVGIGSVNLPNGCQWTYGYSYRHVNCEPYDNCEWKINWIETNDPACLNGVDYRELFDLIEYDILMSNPNNDCEPADDGECIVDIAVSYASCWRWDGIITPSPPLQATLVPCDETQCCRDYYRICYDEQGNRLDPELIWHDGYTTCPSGECFNICE